MLKVWDHTSSVCLALGVGCLIPLPDGTLMLPIWASLALVGFGAVSQLTLRLLLDRLKN
jgi:hypothetical protein